MTVQIVCIMQARTGSTRLSGKVLLPILDKPMLWWDMYRVQKSKYIDEVVIATTTNPADDALVQLCQDYRWNVTRGSEEDVLDRYYQAAKQYNATHIVRITSDCPLIDAQVVDTIIAGYLSAAPSPDYGSNVQIRSYPRGLDTEIFSMSALDNAWNNAKAQPEREHVTPFMRQNPDRFRLHDVVNPQDFSSHRWTVDTPEDMALVQNIYQHFGHGDFHWQDVLAVLNEYPEWVLLNQHIEQKKL